MTGPRLTAEERARIKAKWTPPHPTAEHFGALKDIAALDNSHAAVDAEIKELRDVLDDIASVVEGNRQAGVYTDDDWIITRCRDAVAAKEAR